MAVTISTKYSRVKVSPGPREQPAYHTYLFRRSNQTNCPNNLSKQSSEQPTSHLSKSSLKIISQNHLSKSSHLLREANPPIHASIDQGKRSLPNSLFEFRLIIQSAAISILDDHIARCGCILDEVAFCGEEVARWVSRWGQAAGSQHREARGHSRPRGTHPWLLHRPLCRHSGR